MPSTSPTTSANRPAFWRTRLESIVLTVVAAIVTIVAMVLLVVVPISLDVAAWFLEQPLQQVSFYNGARYLLGIGLLLGLLMTLYKLLPNVQLRAA